MSFSKPAKHAAGRVPSAFGALTHVGCVRGHNEDSLVAESPLFAVADGMGGHEAGEVASRIAIETMLSMVPTSCDPSALSQAVVAANRAVLEGARNGTGRPGMGTTCTAAVVFGDEVAVAQVGDSRAYLLHAGALQRITRDHSLVAEYVAQGRITEEEARVHPQRSVITRALGSDLEMLPDTYKLRVEEGDRLLLCSDGLTSMVEDKGIEAILAREESPQECCQALLDEALAAGGLDNVSVIVVDPLAEGGSQAVGAAGSSTSLAGAHHARHSERAKRVEESHADVASDASQAQCSPYQGEPSGEPDPQSSRLPLEGGAVTPHGVTEGVNATRADSPELTLSASLRSAAPPDRGSTNATSADSPSRGSTNATSADSPSRGSTKSVSTSRSVPKSIASKPRSKSAAPKAGIIAFVLIVLVAAGVFAGFVYSSYYVGVSDSGTIAVYHGLPGKVGNISASWVEEESDLAADQLIESTQQHLQEGVPVDSLDAGRALIEEYRHKIVALEDVPTSSELDQQEAEKAAAAEQKAAAKAAAKKSSKKDAKSKSSKSSKSSSSGSDSAKSGD